MKKLTVSILVLIMALAMFTGCGQKEATAPPTPEKVTADVMPMEPSIDMENLDECVIPVAFYEGDAYLDDTGKLQVNIDVYSIIMYDLDSIRSLEKGQTIVGGDKPLKITSIEENDKGEFLVNEEYMFTTEDGWTYYLQNSEGEMLYMFIGEALVRVSTEFEYLNLSAESAEVWYPGDLLKEEAPFEYDFSPETTTLEITGGQAMNLVRSK